MPPPRRKLLPSKEGEIFVNRETPLRIFEDAAFSIPDDRSIVRVFYGPGGQGKTALSRFLFQATSPNNDSSYAFLKRAELDLHGKSKTDPDHLLVWIRNGFAASGIAFPTFDLALALAWEVSRGEQEFPILTNAWLAKSADALAGAAPDAVQAVRETVEKSVETIPGLGILITKGSKWVIDKTKRVYLERTRDSLKELYRGGELKKAYELSEILPWMLAQDLNHHCTRHPEERLVLFVDEYERVFEEGGAGARWRENPFDSHMRALVQESNGLLAVFFSRERLPWRDDPDWRDDLKDCQFLLGGLSESDADDWLRKIPIGDEKIRRAIIEGAREEPKDCAPVYPLMVDLQIEHWRSLIAADVAITPTHFQVTAETFRGRCAELVQRVFRDYGDELQVTLERLSVANRFDRAAFEHVVRTFETALPFDAFDRIRDLSFISEIEGNSLTMHRAVAEAVQSTLGDEKRRASAVALFDHYEMRAKSSSPRDVTDQTVFALMEAAQLRWEIEFTGYVSWLDEMSKPLTAAARYTESELLWRQSLQIVEDNLGREHPDTAVSYTKVAISLNAQGRYEEADPFYRAALQIYERVLAEGHPTIAASYNNVAFNLNALGRYEEAEPLYRAALEIMERVFGEDHPATAASYNNVATNLNDQGRYEEAEPLNRAALEINERVLGAGHPSLAASYNNVAYNLHAQGRYEEAGPLYRAALEICQRVVGEDHPSTALTYNNVASNLNSRGRHEEAEPLYRAALEVRERVLGADHPDTAMSYNNVASNLVDQGRYEEAEPLFRRALEINERVLGEDHPSTAMSYNNVAYILNTQGRYVEAEALFRKALETCQRVIGEDHPKTAMSYNNVASNLVDQGRYEEAEPLLRKALEIREHVLGAEHPDTAASYNNTASNLNARGRYEEAEPFYRAALEINERVLGADHPDTATSYNNVATNLNAQGRYEEAEPLHRKALEISERVLGADHPDIATSYNNMATNLNAQSRYEEAEPLYRKALEISERVFGEDHPNTKTFKSNLQSLLGR